MADEIDALYATPPAAFVQARNALAKTLKAAGRREEAARVAALSRPSPSVWAVNQIARRTPELVARLGALTVQLQKAAGSGGYAGLVNEHRDLLKTLREKGAEILEGAGLRAPHDVLAAVVQNLRAGMADPAARPLVESGRLECDVESEALASGFAPPPDGPTLRLVPMPSPTPSSPDKGAAERERAQAEKRRAEALSKRAEAQGKRAEAQGKIDRLRAALREAQQRQSVEEDARAKAAAALGEAERRLVTARDASARAAADLARAEADLAALPR